MHTRNFFFSPQGGRSSHIKNRTIRPHLYSQSVQGLEWTVEWNGVLSGRVLAYSSLASTNFP
nr:unnamed protein product [Callosobruchus chinensis]